MSGTDMSPPELPEIRAAREALGDRVRETPTWRWRGRRLAARIGDDTAVWLKLELFQYTGTFKPRGALVNMMALDSDELARGVCAVSAGNHAVAVAYAARMMGTTAKVVMLEGASPARIEGCRAYGAEVVMADFQHAFDEVHRIEAEEGRAFVHPFEGKLTTLGTATLGWELVHQVEPLDAVIVPIGGGGLCAGVSTAIKLAWPECAVYGVEPEGADTMHRSFASGRPEKIDKSRTIADSLGAPYAAPYTFELCRKNVDRLVKIDDDAMRDAMRLMFDEAKLAVEPAGAAATAALVGPLASELAGQRVGLIVCGTNIDLEGFHRILAGGPGR